VKDNPKKLNEIFDRCFEGLLSGSLTLDECLKQYPEYAHELEALLQTALSVEKAAAITPSPEIKAHIRYHLQLRMAHVGKAHRAAFRSWQPRWAIAVMAVLLILLLGSSTVFAAGGSMPGSPLYPVKIATEDVRLSLTSSPVSKAELYATYADRRVVELGYLAEKGNTKAAQVEKIAERYTHALHQIDALPLKGTKNETVMATGMITTSPTATVSPTTTPLNTNLTNQTTTQTSTTRRKATPSVSTKTQATATQQSSSEESPLAHLTPAEREHMMEYFAYLADSHPQELQNFLDQFPEQSRPAIRRMIEEAKTVYPKLNQTIQSYQNSEQK